MKIILLIATLGILNFGFTQNLVPNASFETIDTCQLGGGSIASAYDWWGVSTSDLFNVCSFSSSYRVPSNGYGYQNAYDGNGYAFFVNYVDTPAVNDREYVQAKLLSILSAGTRYYVTFRISFADKFRFASDGIGAFFSQDTVYGQGPGFMIDSIPQVSVPDGIAITDSSNWVLVQGSFISSGFEEYITIGNFKNDAQATVQDIGIPGALGGYFLDAVCVSPDSLTCYNFVGIEELTDQNQIKLYPNPANEVVYVESDEPIERIELYNLTGQMILNEEDSYRLDISHLVAGLYLMKIKTEDGIKIKKLVKE